MGTSAIGSEERTSEAIHVDDRFNLEQTPGFGQSYTEVALSAGFRS